MHAKRLTPIRSPAASPGPPPNAIATRLVLAALVVVLAIRLAAGLSSSNWLWGIAPERYWPLGGQVALLLFAASGFVPGLGRLIERALHGLGTAWERAGLRGDLLVAAVAGIALFVLRDPVRFTGDSSLREGLVTLPAEATARLMIYYFPLDRLANIALPRLLWRSGVDPSTALQAVGAMVGAAYVLVCCTFLRGAGARGAALAGGALVLLGAGTLPHFAGYDKLGPLMLGLALCATGAVRLARGSGGLRPLVAGAAIAVLSHRSGYLVLAAVAAALVAAFRTTSDSRRRRRILIAAACVIVPAAAMLPHAAAVARQLDLATHLPGGQVSGARMAGGPPAAFVHLADAVNTLWFLVPLWLTGVAAGLAARTGAGEKESAPRRRAVPLGPIAWLALAPAAALVLVITPGGGWARDWDDGVGLGALASLATAYALAAWWRRGVNGTLAPVATLAASATIALWGVHANEDIGLKRVETLLEARPAWSAAIRAEAYDLLGQRSLSAGNPERAAKWLTRAIACAPNPRYFHELGLAEEARGSLTQAEAAFRHASELNPAVSDPWVGRARVALASGDSANARAYADSALARNPGKAEALRLRQDLAGAS